MASAEQAKIVESIIQYKFLTDNYIRRVLTADSGSFADTFCDSYNESCSVPSTGPPQTIIPNC
ncbi:hypothetical protein BDV34DRAFT_192336 [Aspergillus parasiticus]|uniref:Uncharacterized protein n=1 Tax=Aspergillus parasiticus TaxID=5067 RepID=A0A5N6DPS2_ASPPA|nr:hypothetical protein BDV34DRAFT_192336 [Aspergillus parasiticus]